MYVNFSSLALKFQDLSRCCRSQTIRTFLVKFLISSNFGQRQRLQCKQKVGSCVRNDCGLISAAAEDISVNLSLNWEQYLQYTDHSQHLGEAFSVDFRHLEEGGKDFPYLISTNIKRVIRDNNPLGCNSLTI